MKTVITADLDGIISEQFFLPIRTKIQQSLLVLRAMKFFMNIDKLGHSHEAVGKLILSRSKMNRLTVVKPNKIFSVAFPFSFEETEQKVIFKSRAVGVIDSITISLTTALLSDPDVIEPYCIANLADKILDSTVNSPNLWGFLQEILFCEDGYVRFDRDEKNENGHLHPLDHLDIFYSSNATFKVGLKTQIEEQTLIDILDLTTECHYLEKVT